MATDSNGRSNSALQGAPDSMAILAAVMNARFALEYWMREVSVNAPDAGWAKSGTWRSQNECETLQWIEDHIRSIIAISTRRTPA